MRTPRPQSTGTRTSLTAEVSFVDLKLDVEYIPISTLRSYARHARTHSKRQIGQIAESIRAFGFISPIVADEAGEIIAGHGRLAAAQQLGYADVPVVRIEHLNDAQKRALRLADNRLADLAGWDEALLALEFKDLLEIDLTLELDFDLAITGFASADVDRLVETTAAATSQDDALPRVEAGEPPVSRVGDLWRLGDHLIVCGDAQDRASYDRLLGTERAAMAIHDFPYDVKIGGHVSKRGRHREFVMGSGELGEHFMPFLATCLSHTSSVLRPGGLVFAFMDWRHMVQLLMAGGEAGLELKNLCVWNKGTGAMGGFYRSQHELVFVFHEPSAQPANNVQLGKFGRNRTNVWDYPGAAGLKRELELHPTPKPVALVADAIRDASDRNDLVLDAFSGSGTTIIAAAKTGRRARVIELDPIYVDLAIRRWQDWSGQTAVHADTGMSFADLTAQRHGSMNPVAPLIEHPSERSATSKLVIGTGCADQDATDASDNLVRSRIRRRGLCRFWPRRLGRAVRGWIMDEIDPTAPADLDTYQVGHGKPPKSGQFKPGQSGNPGGRRKGSRNLKHVFDDVLSNDVELTINGKKRRVPAVKALVMRQVQEGLRGELRAIENVLDRYERYGGAQAQDDEETSADDKAIMQRLIGGRARALDEPGEGAEAPSPEEAGDD